MTATHQRHPHPPKAVPMPLPNPASADFLFDFGSPNAYLCHGVIPAIEARTGLRLRYVPVLLGGLFKLANNRSPAEAFAGIPNKRAMTGWKSSASSKNTG